MDAASDSSKDQMDVLSLFDYAHLSLPETPQKPAIQTRPDGVPYLALVIGDVSVSPVQQSSAHQLALALPHDTDVLIDFVSATQKGYLNYHIRDFLSDEPHLKPIAVPMEARDRCYVGHLAQMHGNTLIRQRIATPDQVSALQCFMKRGGLRLGMHIPQWTAPNGV